MSYYVLAIKYLICECAWQLGAGGITVGLQTPIGSSLLLVSSDTQCRFCVFVCLSLKFNNL